MLWTPASLDLIKKFIADAKLEFTDEDREYWHSIVVEPEKWQQHQWGERGGGFWVVGKTKTHVLNYNDIEDGFGWSAYRENGVIDECHYEQDDLIWALRKGQ